MYEEIFYEGFTEEELAGFRTCLSEEYREADDEELEALLDEISAEMTAEQFGQFVRSLGSLGSRIGSAITRNPDLVGAGIGAGVTALTGNPAAGAAAGNIGSTLVRGTTSPQRPTPQQSPAAAKSASANVAPMLDLLSLLDHPILLQTLMSLILQGIGQQSGKPAMGRGMVPVGNTSASPPAIVNALRSLANQTQMQAARMEAFEAIPSYLLNERGEAIADIYDSDKRAEILVERLKEDEALRLDREFFVIEEYDEFDEDYTEDYEEDYDEELDDAIEFIEI